MDSVDMSALVGKLIGMTNVTISGEFQAGTPVTAYDDNKAAVWRRLGWIPQAPAVESTTVGSNSKATFSSLSVGGMYIVAGRSQETTQTITVKATAGTFKASFGGSTSSDLAFDIAAADLQTALRALGATGAVVTGGPGDSAGTTPYTVVLTNPATPITTDATSLTGSTHTATVAATAGPPQYVQVAGPTA